MKSIDHEASSSSIQLRKEGFTGRALYCLESVLSLSCKNNASKDFLSENAQISDHSSCHDEFGCKKNISKNLFQGKLSCHDKF
jgi:hypothetical protein